ncbi:MAG: LPS-assembly protein LptD [Oligoflexia bacterium]|nr:LPS-assembly protein LptD [Oligoflexia bacterium]
MTNLIFKIFFLIASIAFGQPQKNSIILNADSYNTNPDGTADLEGNVKVVRDSEILTCDKAKINNKTSDVFAQGNVTLITPKDFIRAQRMNYNFNTKKGVIYNGLIQTGQETIEGEVIYKTGEEQFRADKASYTSCVNCPPSWKLSGKSIDATLGGYAYITHPIVKIYNIPVLWLPWIAIPIKNKRQSGLLAPNLEIKGNGGGSFGESYFWAIDDSKDATLYASYYDKRGFKSGLEYRFVSDVNSSGSFKGTYLNDRYFGDTDDYKRLDERYAGSGTNREMKPNIQRFSIKYKQHVELPDGFSHNAKVNLVSDTRYLYDFSEDISGANEPALDNRINLSKITENTQSSIDVSIYQNLLKVDPLGPNDQTIHRMPEVKYSISPQKFLGFGLLSVDFDYVNFTNSGKTFYGPSESATTFDLETSQYRAGQRLIFRPSFALAFNIFKLFDVLPQIEYEEIFYQFGYSAKPTTSRRFVRTSLNLKTRLSGIYGEDNSDIYATKFKHEIVPELNYSVIPSFYQEDHPFFGTQTLPFSPNYTSSQPVTEFDTIQFDYEDRFVDQNVITYALTNKIIRKKHNQEGLQYREIIFHKFSQTYDVYSAKLPDLYTDSDNVIRPTIKQPWGELKSYFALNLDYLSFSSDISYYPYEIKTIYSYSLGLYNGKGDGLSLGYSQGFQIRPNYSDPSLSRLIFGARSETASISAYFTTKYLNFNGTTNFDIINSWNPTSFSIRGLLKPPGKCWGFGFYLNKVFGGEFSFSWTLPIFFGEGRSIEF